nr:serine recombinase [Desulfobacterales bacterium]
MGDIGVTEVRAAIYARVSTARQEQERTIESQLDDLRERVAADGLTDVSVYKDEGYSRDNLNRPALKRLLDALELGTVNRVYAHSLDRLGVGYALFTVYEMIEKSGAELVLCKGDIDDTPEGKLLMVVMGGIGDYEKYKINERTKRGKVYWSKQGALVSGVKPYGYDMVRRSGQERAKLEINETEAEVVRSMFRMLNDEGMSVRGIAARLSDAGVPTARNASKWYPAAVHRMLTNETYAGRMVYRRKGATTDREVVVEVPAIVDEATFRRANERLAENAARSKRRNFRHSYLLRTLIRCPRCGGKYSGWFRNGRRYYRCHNSDGRSIKGEKCKLGAFHAEPVERAVWDEITKLLERPDLVMAEFERRMADNGQAHLLDVEADRLRKDLGRVKSRISRTLDLYIDGQFERAILDDRVDGMRREQSELETRLAEVESQKRDAESLDRTRDAVTQFCETIRDGLDGMTFDERQKLLQEIVESVIVSGDDIHIKGAIPAKPISGGAVDCDLQRNGHPELDSGSLGGINRPPPLRPPPKAGRKVGPVGVHPAPETLQALSTPANLWRKYGTARKRREASPPFQSGQVRPCPNHT